MIKSVQEIFVIHIAAIISSLITAQVPVNRDSPIQYANFHKLAGQFLNATGLAADLSVAKSSECGLKCLLHKKCVSFNYGGSGGTNCKILGFDRFANSSSLKHDAKYDYYYIKRVCDDNPCGNNGKCISYDDSNNFTCDCTRLFTGKTCTDQVPCKDALGMANGKILDSQLSMSSYLNNDATYGEKNGRLNKIVWPYGAQTNTADKFPWFKIDLLQIKYVSGVGIQGYHNGQSWTTSFAVSTSTDGSSWTMYQEIPGTNKTFPANTDANTEVRGMFKAPIAARLVKVFATTCKGHCTFRLELYGCSLQA